MCLLSLGAKQQAPEGYPLLTPPLRIAVSPQPAPVQPQLLPNLLWISAELLCPPSLWRATAAAVLGGTCGLGSPSL